MKYNESHEPIVKAAGFTLIELMIVIVIVAILASIAVPAYNDYVIRGKLSEAYTNLAGLRVRMEQYFQDNRTYVGGPCVAGASDTKYFTYACNPAATQTTFKIVATGQAGVAGFNFSIDETNTKRTEGVGSGWTAPAGNCWVLRKDGSC